MLTIKINDKVLAIDPSTKLRFDINSTLFETDAIPGSYICPFDIPVKDNNFFENAEFIEVNRLFKKYPCMVFLNNTPIFSGELILNSTLQNKYRVSVILTGIASDFPDKKLNELNYGSDITFASAVNYAKTNNSITDDSAVCVFPTIYVPNMYGNSDDDSDSPANADFGGHEIVGVNISKTGKFINYWNAQNQTFPINEIQPSNVPKNDNRFVLVPQFKLIFVVKKLFESLGYTVSGDFFADSFLSKLLFMNYFAMDDKKKKYFLSASHPAVFTNAQLFNGTIPFNDITSLGNEDQNNSWDMQHNCYTIQTIGWHSIKAVFSIQCLNLINGNSHFSLSANVMNLMNNGIFTYGGYSVQANFNYFTLNEIRSVEISANFYFNTADIGKKIIITGLDNTGGYAFRFLSAKLNITATSYQNLNRFSNKIKIANHVTSNTVGTVLNSLKLNFGLALFFDAENKTIEISFLKDILKSFNSIDITENVIKNSVEISIEENKGFLISQKNDEDISDIDNLDNIGSFIKKTDLPVPDKLNVIAEVLQEGCFYQYKKNDTTFALEWIKFGTSVREIKEGNETENVSLDISVTTNVLKNNVLVPYSKQQGTSDFFDTGINDTDLQLLNWYGMKKNLLNMYYPFASALKFDAFGNIINDIELRLDGPCGLYKNYLESWYNFIDNAETVNLQLKIDTPKLIEILKVFKPQENTASQQIRKLKYKNILLLPKAFSIIIPVSGGYIESEIEVLKEGGIEL
jgi:hypothetical protein